jgi:hypothetical protein
MDTMIDEYWGQGGSYLLNPKTGKRTLIERTEPAQSPELPTEDLSDATTVTQAADSGQD